MPVAKSMYAFPDCREFMNKAIHAEKGWRLRFEKKGPAISFRQRCYTARRREAAFSAKLSPEDMIMQPWDELIFFINEAGEQWELIAVKDGQAALDTQVTWEGPVE